MLTPQHLEQSLAHNSAPETILQWRLYCSVLCTRPGKGQSTSFPYPFTKVRLIKAIDFSSSSSVDVN
ncbi:hypothetical protein GOP47_0028463 [Adiantum capillus-veneris]|nr:hypothetical protein GOP47_0028463 [Adiantum capillus-veneris]